jgi:Domain of unknown function (DUF4397)
MLRLRHLLVPACLAVVALAGCGQLNPSGNGTGTTIRFANLVPSTTPVTVTLNGITYMSASPFETINSYQDITSGPYTLNVLLGTSTTPALTAKETLANVSAYTFVSFGPTTAVSGLLIADTIATNVPSGSFGLQLSTVSPTAGLIDAYLTAPGADLAGASPIAIGLLYGTSTSVIIVPVGNYELRLTRSGTNEVIFDAAVPAFASGSNQTMVAYSRGSGELVNVALFVDNGPGQLIDNRLAQYKVVNASSVASPLNVFGDGNLVLSNVPYTGVSGYLRSNAGPHDITVEASATPGATLLSISPALGPATDTSIALTGGAGNMAALVLTDANVATLTGQAQVRFVNVSPAIPSYDAYANQSLYATRVATNSSSGYFDLTADPAGTSYQFDFRLAGTTTTVLTMPAVTLIAGGIYTIYVVGPSTALQGVVTQDF